MIPGLAALLGELGLNDGALAARGLCLFAEAEVLVEADVDADGRVHRLVPEAAQAWREMKTAAAADGVYLRLVSAFRSIERQSEVVRRKLAQGESVDDVLRVCALPGYSEHHTGRAVDVTVHGGALLGVAFAGSAAFVWLQEHAATFGFSLSFPEENAFGYVFEPWHWCYQGD